MFKKLGTRIRNRKVATAVCAGILLILVNLGVIDVEMSHNVESTVNTILGIGVTLGIFGDPESHVK